MEIKFIISIILFSLCLNTCVLHKQPEYIIPKNIPKEYEKDFITYLNKGKYFYNITCEKCHNKKTNEQFNINDFTPENLEAYSIRSKNKEHSENLTENTLSSEELNNVIQYLNHRNKNRAKK